MRMMNFCLMLNLCVDELWGCGLIAYDGFPNGLECRYIPVGVVFSIYCGQDLWLYSKGLGICQGSTLLKECIGQNEGPGLMVGTGWFSVLHRAALSVLSSAG